MLPQRYLVIVAAALATTMFAVGVTNWRIDPFRLRDVAGGSSRGGDREGARTLWHKAFAVKAQRPTAVILGTSRAEGGLDRAHRAFGLDASSVYNLSLGAASIDQIRLLLLHAHSSGQLRLAVVGLDLESFLYSERSDFDPSMLAGNDESDPAWIARVRLLVSWHALRASLLELWNGGAQADGSLRADAGGLVAGRQAMAAQLAKHGGQREMFRMSEFNTFGARRADLFPRRPALLAEWGADPRRLASMHAFRKMLAFARAHGIELRLFVSPVHARYLEWYRQLGLWPLFEAWKRELANALAEEGGTGPHRAALPLWDFSGFNDITTEPIPPVGDRRTIMRWYVDSSHYSRDQGALILDRVLGRADDVGTQRYGVRIEPHTIDPHLARVRRDGSAFRAAYTWEVGNVQQMVSMLRELARK